MYTPHPSLVPLEMASAGLLTVTNTFENKTAGGAGGDLAEPDRRARPTVEGVADGARARRPRRADDAERARARGSRVRWSRDWDESFSEAVMERIEALLG